jgi:hypothetical protein
MLVEDVNLLRIQPDDNFNPYKIKVFLRGVQIKNSNITSLKIKESIFAVLPVIELSFTDDGHFSDVFPLGDEDEIRVEISTHKDLEGIKVSFTTQDYSIIPDSVETLTCYYISITGFLKNDYMLFPSISQAFSRATSSDVLSQLFEDAGFKVTNPIQTNDKMTWIQSNMNSLDMVNHVVDYAYVTDRNMVFACVDKNNNAYIRDLTSEIIKPKTIDIIKSVDPQKLYYSQIQKENKITELGYNYYRFGFHPGFNNKTGGYGMRGYRYDYDKDKIYNVKMNDDIHPMTDYSLKNKDNMALKTFSDAEHFPMKYKGSNFHENYFKAYLQNKYLRKTFFSDILIVNSFFNDEVKLFDKVNINIVSLAHTPAKKLEMNKVYSGDYLVVGIINQITDGGNYKSNLFLSRGGINQSYFINKTEMNLNA